MQGIGCGDGVVLANDHYNILTDRNKIRMGHAQSFAAGKLEHKGFETVSKPFPDTIKIHIFLVAQIARLGKGL